MSNIDKIARRVKALLAQAADQEGTPEGNAFRDMAFELIAKYGVDQTALQDEDDAATTSRTLDLAGAYTPLQLSLLTYIGKALRCVVVGEGSGRKVTRAHVFGRARNVERVLLLFAVLNPQMGAGARNQRATRHGQDTAVMRRSYMLGFVRTIEDRLTEIEGGAVEQAGQALVVRDELLEAARAAQQELGQPRNMASRTRIDQGAARAGSEAADQMDLQQQRMGARPALSM